MVDSTFDSGFSWEVLHSLCQCKKISRLNQPKDRINQIITWDDKLSPGEDHPSYRYFLATNSQQYTCTRYIYRYMYSPCTPISIFDMLPWDLRFLISIMRPQLWHHAYFSLMAGHETWAPRPFFVRGSPTGSCSSASARHTAHHKNEAYMCCSPPENFEKLLSSRMG